MGSMKELIIGCIKDFGNNGVVFSNEAQFQFALAWKIKEKLTKLKMEDYEILLEHLVIYRNEKYYIDILVRLGKELFPIELKYKTAARNLNYGNGKYHTFNQGAEDCGSFDYLKDIMRLETLSEKEVRILPGSEYSECSFSSGFAVMMTNNHLYKEEKENRVYCWQNFFLTQGREIRKGELNWVNWSGKTVETEEEQEKIKKTYGKERLKGIFLKRPYQIQWEPYKDDVLDDDHKKYGFFYLIEQVDSLKE